MAFAITAITCPAGQYTQIATGALSLVAKTRGGGEPFGRVATGASVPLASLTNYMGVGPKDFPMSFKFDSATNVYFMPKVSCIIEAATE